ncbi:MAG: peptide deformylase [Candidatus Cloacimonas acidaminovorans]|jgi:peptide deformylase|nr:peptide deformylase [Candidatus Cloacimonas acidaminovorans]
MKYKPKILPVRLYGDDFLRKKLPEIDYNTPGLQEFIEDLIYTMYARDGIGIAANQVGSFYRMIVIDPEQDNKLNKKSPIVMINPVIENREGEVVYEEGCISLPDVFADVSRSKKITYSYTDRMGNRITETAEEIKAVVIQHEFDHLEGILFIDYLGTLDRLKIMHKLKKLQARAVNGQNILEGLTL